jgi:hypothetical protein
MKTDFQIIHADSPMGPRPMPAPAGTYDKTATFAWSRLLHIAGERQKPAKRKRDEFVQDGQIEVLGNILANSMGMAAFYWTQEAKRLSKMLAAGEIEMPK